MTLACHHINNKLSSINKIYTYLQLRCSVNKEANSLCNVKNMITIIKVSTTQNYRAGCCVVVSVMCSGLSIKLGYRKGQGGKYKLIKRIRQKLEPPIIISFSRPNQDWLKNGKIPEKSRKFLTCWKCFPTLGTQEIFQKCGKFQLSGWFLTFPSNRNFSKWEWGGIKPAQFLSFNRNIGKNVPIFNFRRLFFQNRNILQVGGFVPQQFGLSDNPCIWSLLTDKGWQQQGCGQKRFWWIGQTCNWW